MITAAGSAAGSHVASAPGKILLAGEYAVLEGAEAVVMAVDRRVVARIDEFGGRALSSFLIAARDALAEELGQDCPAVRAAGAVSVDSGALALADGTKLGLGSSAAATVAALGCALASGGENASPDRILALAHRAHASAQRGRGSGVDVAAAALGGLCAATPAGGARPPRIRTLPLPDTLTWIAAFSGRAAHTPTLIAASEAAKARSPGGYAEAIHALAEAAAALAGALETADAPAVVAAIATGAEAVAVLDAVMEPELVIPAHAAIAAAARKCGGAAKPTGAASGDLSIAAFADPEAAARFTAALAAQAISAFEVGPAPGVTITAS